ncbi:MAG: zinc-ribbon domain-containing protein [Oscillospiraceae bacterium]|nr:zinc-ribbon domain-containing protein [Oscillospiraceae bacterium]
MFCTKCGKENAEDSKFCNDCGQSIAEALENQDPRLLNSRVLSDEEMDALIAQEEANPSRKKNKQERLAKKCIKCKNTNLIVAPKTPSSIKVKGIGCLSVAIFLSAFGLIGLLILGSILWQFRNFIIFLVLTSWYFSIAKAIYGRASGVATCQNCGKSWDVNASGNPFNRGVVTAIVKLVLWLALLLGFVYFGMWLSDVIG